MNSYPPEIDLIEIRRELDELRAKVAKLENGRARRTDLESDLPTVIDRRGMMKKMAGLAVGVAAVGLLRPSGISAGGRGNPALDGKGLVPAADGNPLVLGMSNFATSYTFLNQGSPATAFIVQNSSTTVLNAAPLMGRNFASNIPLLPTETAAVLGATDARGSTTPNASIAGVYGSAVTAGSGTASGVIGSGTHIGVSGTGITTNANGVRGIANVGTSARGVEGTSTTGIGGAFTGARAALLLSSGAGAVTDPNVTSPTGGLTGDLYRGSANGSLWYRADSATGTYRRLVDNTTAGALTAFPAASRFVNLSVLNAGAIAAYQIGGMTVTGNTVPTKARAVIGRIADANPTGGGGNLLVGATNPPLGGGVIAVVAGAPQNSSFFSALDATGKLYVRNTSPAGSVQVIIDIQGYYE